MTTRPPSSKAGRPSRPVVSRVAATRTVPYLSCGQFDSVTTELLRVGYRGERTLAVHDRLYPQVRSAS